MSEDNKSYTESKSLEALFTSSVTLDKSLSLSELHLSSVV